MGCFDHQSYDFSGGVWILRDCQSSDPFWTAPVVRWTTHLRTGWVVTVIDMQKLYLLKLLNSGYLGGLVAYS